MSEQSPYGPLDPQAAGPAASAQPYQAQPFGDSSSQVVGSYQGYPAPAPYQPGYPPPAPAYPPYPAYPGGPQGNAYPAYVQQPPVATSKNGWGVASLVASIAGLTVLFGSLIPSVLGVIFGHIALNAAKRGEASNRGVALGGLITGYVGLAVTVIFWGFLILVVGLASLDTIGGYDSWALAPLSGLV